MQVLEVDRRIIHPRPIRLDHGLPAAERIQPPFQQPGRLILLGRNIPDDVLIEALGRQFGFDIGYEPVFVLVDIDRLDGIDRLPSPLPFFSPLRFKGRGLCTFSIRSISPPDQAAVTEFVVARRRASCFSSEARQRSRSCQGVVGPVETRSAPSRTDAAIPIASSTWLDFTLRRSRRTRSTPPRHPDRKRSGPGGCRQPGNGETGRVGQARNTLTHNHNIPRQAIQAILEFIPNLIHRMSCLRRRQHRSGSRAHAGNAGDIFRAATLATFLPATGDEARESRVSPRANTIAPTPFGPPNLCAERNSASAPIAAMAAASGPAPARHRPQQSRPAHAPGSPMPNRLDDAGLVIGQLQQHQGGTPGASARAAASPAASASAVTKPVSSTAR